jgi:hypothetical protein
MDSRVRGNDTVDLGKEQEWSARQDRRKLVWDRASTDH